MASLRTGHKHAKRKQWQLLRARLAKRLADYQASKQPEPEPLLSIQPANPRLNDLPQVCYDLLDRLRGHHKNAFRLHWTGSKIPRGALVDGEPIGWTQHGIVSTDQRHNAGYYTRVEEWSGPNHDQHEMLISTDGMVQIPSNRPDMTVEQIRFNLQLEVTA